MSKLLAGGLGRILPYFRFHVRIVAILAMVSTAVLMSGLQPAFAKPVAASIVVDAETGEVLSLSNADTLTYPASLTKMMTLYLLFDALDSGKVSLADKITFSKHAASEPATNLNAKAGYTISVETAILALVIRSANDVATAVGEHLGGSEAKFARMMTEKAHALGMTRTTFRNAHGLPDDQQRTTARDMAVLGIAMLRDHPGYYGYFSRNKFTYRSVAYVTHNRVLRKFPGADGIKTGYIRASGFNLVTSAERDGRRLVGVVMGGPSGAIRDQQMVKLLTVAFKKQNGIGQVLVAKAPGSAKSAKAIAVAATNENSQSPVVTSAATSYDDAVAVAALLPVVKPITRAEMDDLDTATTLAAMTSVSLAQASRTKPDSQAVANVWGGKDRIYGVQVGAYSKYAPAQKAAQRATSAVPDLLADARIVIDQSKTGNGSSLYRARVFGLSKGDAADACLALKAKRTDCLVIQGDSSVAQTAQ